MTFGDAGVGGRDLSPSEFSSDVVGDGIGEDSVSIISVSIGTGMIYYEKILQLAPIKIFIFVSIFETNTLIIKMTV